MNAVGNGDGSKATTEYLALFDNIIHRLRFPKFLEIVKRQLDDEVSSSSSLFFEVFQFSACNAEKSF